MTPKKTKAALASSLCTLCAWFLLLSSQSLAQSIDLSRLIFDQILLTAEIEAQAFPLEADTDEASLLDISSQALARTLDIDQYEQALFEIETRAGPFTVDLAEQLGSLGTLYSENGDHLQAIATFERARHIIRINHGLFTLQQIEFVEGLIASYSNLDDAKNLNQMKEYLFYIQQKNYTANEPAMVAAKLAWADWNIQAFHNIYSKKNAPLFNTGNQRYNADDYVLVHDTTSNTYTYVSRNQLYGSGGSSGMNPSINMQALVEPRLLLAQEIYTSALEHNQTQVTKAELREKLANIAFISKTQMAYLDNAIDHASLNNRGFQSRSTSTLIARGYSTNLQYFENNVITQRNSADPVELAQALLELADWHLLFDHPREALPIYQEAYTVLLDTGRPATDIATLLLPSTPLPLPTFSAQPYSREIYGFESNASLDYKGYIDIRLSLGSQGNNRSIKVLESSDGTTKQIRVTLLDYLRTQKTRPALTDGQAVERTDLKFRFYYSY